MKTLSAILFVCICALTAFGQQLTLNGTLKTDEGKPVPATRISVANFERTTDAQGRFKLALSGDFSEGERVILKVIKPNWVINYPLDGEWNLPNVKLQTSKRWK
ncbi:MAG: carboxypeptidase-like regulatory domain-containing protein [Acidobacteriota bacterium]|nr:carboxypeptidase-like regulatory domain-containing protein [Acidobacteriota bacterium]